VKGTLTNYRYDLTLELTPDERYTLIALLRSAINYDGFGTKHAVFAQELLTILNVKP
jgi:hypothetical protein